MKRLGLSLSGACVGMTLLVGAAMAQGAADPTAPVTPPAPGSAAASAAAAAGLAKPAAKPAPARKVVRIPLPPRRPADLDRLAAAAQAAAQEPATEPSLDDSGLGGADASAVPARTPAEKPAEKPAKLQQVAAVDLSPKAILDHVNASLNAMTVMTADFVQVSGNGRRSEGRLYVQKPGRLRFEYDPPNPVEIVADGSKVAIRDRKLNTQDVYPIGQTPLKFLLKDQVDITRDTKVVDVQPGRDLVSVTIEDRSTFGGTSRVEMRFDPRTYVLKQWTVTDPQGFETTVNLKNISPTKPDDPNIFSLDYMRQFPR